MTPFWNPFWRTQFMLKFKVILRAFGRNNLEGELRNRLWYVPGGRLLTMRERGWESDKGDPGGVNPSLWFFCWSNNLSCCCSKRSLIRNILGIVKSLGSRTHSQTLSRLHTVTDYYLSVIVKREQLRRVHGDRTHDTFVKLIYSEALVWVIHEHRHRAPTWSRVWRRLAGPALLR